MIEAKTVPECHTKGCDKKKGGDDQGVFPVV